MARRWTLVSWDATQTLLRLRRPVGAVYAELGARAGLHAAVDAAALDRAFGAAYAQTDKQFINFGHGNSSIPSTQAWWSLVISRTFRHAGVTLEELAPVLPTLVETAYEEFRTDRCWQLATPRVHDVLRLARTQADCMAVISNFDERLPDVLASLGIRGYFDVVLGSVAVGAAKPSTRLFEHAMAAAAAPPGSPPPVCLHIGDHWAKDVQAALQLSQWCAVWVRGAQPDVVARPARPTRYAVVKSVDDLLPAWPTPADFDT